VVKSSNLKCFEKYGSIKSMSIFFCFTQNCFNCYTHKFNKPIFKKIPFHQLPNQAQSVAAATAAAFLSVQQSRWYTSQFNIQQNIYKIVTTQKHTQSPNAYLRLTHSRNNRIIIVLLFETASNVEESEWKRERVKYQMETRS
jgi:hypothetical protein